MSGRDYGGPERRDGHWHLDKRLNVSHLLTTVVLTVGIFSWAGTMDKRVALLEAQIRTQTELDQRQDRDRLALGNEIKDQLRQLNNKLDRIIERELTNGFKS